MKQNNKTGLYWSLICVAVFTALMLFGLKQNANFTPSVLVGKPAPSFTASLYPIGEFQSDIVVNKKKWTVINFWSSTCVVCREEAQELEQFYQTTSGQKNNDPTFISINIQEDVQTIAEWQRDYKQTFPVVMDKNGHISILFGVTGTPETFLIDRDGIVRYRIAGTITTDFIFKFIDWFESHKDATETEARNQFENAAFRKN